MKQNSMINKDFALFQTFNLPIETEDERNVVIGGFEPSDNPFIPRTSGDYHFRKDFIREVRSFLKAPNGDALYIAGPTGSGKTSGITEVLGRLNWPCQQVTAHGRMEADDLIGHHMLVSSKPGEPPVMRFQYGPLARAMHFGHVLLINEVDMMEPSELTALNDVLEGRPLVIAQNGGEVIQPHPNFRVVVTGNSCGNGGSEANIYQGVLMQNMASLDRYRWLIVDYMSAEAELKMLKCASSLTEDILSNMVKVANLIRTAFKQGTDQQLTLTMSTRVLKRWARQAEAFRSAPNPLAYALEIAILRRAGEVEREIVTRFCRDVFGPQWK